MSAVDFTKFIWLAPIPAIAFGMILALWKDLGSQSKIPDWRPCLYAVGIFLTGYLGLAASLFPYLVPFELTIWDTAARDNALALMFVGAVIMLPVILGYTAYVHKIFWGKVKPGDGYHG